MDLVQWLQLVGAVWLQQPKNNLLLVTKIADCDTVVCSVTINEKDDGAGNIVLGEPLVNIPQHLQEYIPVHPTFSRVHNMPLASCPILGKILKLFPGIIFPGSVDHGRVGNIARCIDAEARRDTLLGVARTSELWSCPISNRSKDLLLPSSNGDTSFVL